MTIEINAPHNEIGEELVNRIKSSVMNLYHLDRNICRAEVYLHEGKAPDEKRCDIRLSIYKDEIFSSRSAASYEAASKLVLDDLNYLLTQNWKERQETEEVTSTVEVE